MTVFDNFKSRTVDELAEWLNEYCAYDCAPWIFWFDTTYCKNCEPEIVESDCHRNMEYGWCELNGKCRYFQHMNEIPNNKQVIKMWLEREV